MRPPPDDDARAVGAQASGTSGKADSVKHNTERAAARARFRRAKVACSSAAKAVLAGEPEAVVQAAGGFQEVRFALEELARVGADL
jgi:hypothetical protein